MYQNANTLQHEIMKSESKQFKILSCKYHDLFM